METPRVVVTGYGALSPLGLDAESTWQALKAGENGVAPITLFDAADQEARFAAEVKGFEPTQYLDRKEARRMDRFVQFGVVAAGEALRHAGLEITPSNAEDIGVIVGSGIGGITTLAEQVRVLNERGPKRVSPFTVPMMITDMASGQISITYGAKGPNYCVTSACASSADAIGTAFEAIRRGEAVAMIAGGAEAAITPIGIAAFASAQALSSRNDDPARASRPFDRDRDGFVMGEGAAVLVLERLDHALARGATIHAEVIGYGATSDAYHITQPAAEGEGGARAMRRALRQAGVAPGDVDYINAHGTSTPINDRFETAAIKTVFGEDAYRIPISSTKSMVGHLLGAAGAIEAVASIRTMIDGVIHPTINYETADPECDLDYVPNQARPAQVRTCLSNSLGFGGHNSTLVFRAFDGT
ncbi:MAG TPA: beta-ketoacyl-ACP synthase II [Dehalococcoidia bacterium]|nr:beta-ketoacyl-ACP synthase II [Dehalococcoidia bacterium]